eukprot:77408-Prymnesium_polylepis.1
MPRTNDDPFWAGAIIAIRLEKGRHLTPRHIPTGNTGAARGLRPPVLNFLRTFSLSISPLHPSRDVETGPPVGSLDLTTHHRIAAAV